MTTGTEHDSDGVIIIGGGLAGLETANSLRAEGYPASITIVAEEAVQPYQRPPLSKDYLAPARDGVTPSPLPLHGPTFLEEHRITLLVGIRATEVDRQNKTVRLEDGSRLKYGTLIFATGARNRELQVPGSDLQGVHGLRTLSDAEDVCAALGEAKSVVVVGAGFIGLEFATAARAHGCEVTVLEVGPRPMGRAVTPELGEWFAEAHRGLGINMRMSEGIASFEEGAGGRVVAAVSSTGNRYPADLVMVGVGVVPNVQLAAESGLETDNGIVVDENLRTDDPHVYAVGDCANFPCESFGGQFRLESVQNAVDQARHAAKAILGRNEPYRDLPWFYSTQGPFRLQIANLVRQDDETVMIGHPEQNKFSLLCFREGILAAVESVNVSSDHMAARKILAAGIEITREAAMASGFTLRAAHKEMVSELAT